MELLLQILSPLVSAIVAVVGAYQATMTAADNRQREMEKHMNERDIELKTELAAMSAEVRLLSERTDKHNNLVERMAHAESDIANLYHRYDDMKKGA